MNSVFDNYRYQLVYPIQSTTVQIAKNIAVGSKKCYNELKSRRLTPPLFVVHSLDTNELFHYEIPKYKKNIDHLMIVGESIQHNGGDQNGGDQNGGVISTQPNNDHGKDKMIENIIRRLEILENKVNTIV